MSKFSIVEIDGVTSNIPRSDFDEVDLDILADSILESGGILKPLILKKIGFEKYEVIEGHFEYYGAVRAREKNPNRGEIVNAFIIPPEKEDAAINQVAFIQKTTSNEIKVKASESENDNIDMSNLLDQKLKPIYAKLNQQISNTPATTTPKLDSEERLKAIENKIEHLSALVEKLLTSQYPPKLNLLTAKAEEIKSALNEVKANANQKNAALKAIEYWKQPGKNLTWNNLYQSTKSGEHKIPNFANGTYQKLKQIAEINTP